MVDMMSLNKNISLWLFSVTLSFVPLQIFIFVSRHRKYQQ